MAARRFALINPNTDPAVTARMRRRALDLSPPGVMLDGVTAPFGAKLITTEAALAEAEEAVVALAPRLQGFDGVLVAAFGDPGLDALRRLLALPVAGIGESALRKAARGGRRFCVATTTPDLARSIDRHVAALGLGGNYAGVVLTCGDAAAVTNSPKLLDGALAAAIERARAQRGVEAIAIGGGPLSDAAARLAGRFHVELVDPIEAGIAALLGPIE